MAVLERMSEQIYKRRPARQSQRIQQRCPNALRVFVLVVLACGLSTLNACKIYYKRGEDGGVLTADQAECQRRTGDAAGERYQVCLRELGWVTTGRPSEAGTPAIDEQDAEKNEEAPSQAKDPIEPEPKMTTPVEVDVRPALSPPQAIPANAIRQAPDGVGSWFKFGVNPAQLKTDQADCLTQTQHSKQSLSWSVDPDFLACMRARGWRALAE